MPVIGFILFITFGIAQIVAGYAAIDFHFGAVWAAVWAVVVIFSALTFRFVLPIIVGAFFGAIDVWHWHWALALLFAAPGLVLIIPGVTMFIIEGVKK